MKLFLLFKIKRTDARGCIQCKGGWGDFCRDFDKEFEARTYCEQDAELDYVYEIVNTITGDREELDGQVLAKARIEQLKLNAQATWDAQKRSFRETYGREMNSQEIFILKPGGVRDD